MQPIRIHASLSGSFKAWVDRDRTILARAVTAGVTIATEGVKLDLRRVIEEAALGRRLGNAIGHAVYPSGRASLRAAGSIYPRGTGAAKILTAHSEGAMIRGRDGKHWLLLPGPGLPVGRQGDKPITPGQVEERYNRDLRYIPLGPNKAVLVMDNVVRALRGGQKGRQATRRRLEQGRATTSVIMFILIAPFQLRKRFDVDSVVARWEPRVPALIERALPED